MKNILTIDDFKAMLECALKNIREREEEFSRLDAVIGDGDHGQAIVTAMTAVVETARKGTEFKAMLNDMGFDVMLQVSGSTSTLLGAFFLGMSDCASGTELDAEGVRRMFAGGLSNVQKQTQAKPGDKTMIDAMVPAIASLDESLAAGTPAADALAAAAQAAAEGAEATTPLVARKRRASYLGERSRGHKDPGATSFAYCMAAIAACARS